MLRKYFCWVLFLLILTSCSQKEFFDKFVPHDAVDFAKQYLTLFRTRDYDTIEKQLDPTIRTPGLRGALEKMAGLVPSDEPESIKVVGSRTFSSSQTWQANLSFEYQYPKQWLLVSIVLERKGETFIVKGVNIQPLRASLEEINRFTWTGKTAICYVILALSILVPIFSLAVLVLCIRTKIPKYKWLWGIFILLGFFQVYVDWTSCQVRLNPCSFQLLGTSFWRGSPYSSWIIGVSIPVGAILFLIRRKKWLMQEEPARLEPEQSEAPASAVPSPKITHDGEE